MRCPFLREAQVKSCGASEIKKMIVRIPNQSGIKAEERCSSSEYVSCPWSKQHHEELPNQARCPFLQESLVQYCSGASVTKYVPYSDPSISRCGTSTHRYCELFLMISHPTLQTFHDVYPPTIDSDDGGPWIIDSIQITGWHSYSLNHMWLETDDEGICHIGIDPFFAKVIGKLDRLTFASTSGFQNPSIVMTVNGVEFPVVFPSRINITSTNSHLRADPNRVLTDPYTFGWLFEGTEIKNHGDSGVKHGLIHGTSTRTWMQKETRRLSGFVHEKLSRDSEYSLLADGGAPSDELTRSLTKEELLVLFNEFFLSRT